MLKVVQTQFGSTVNSFSTFCFTCSGRLALALAQHRFMPRFNGPDKYMDKCKYSKCENYSLSSSSHLPEIDVHAAFLTSWLLVGFINSFPIIRAAPSDALSVLEATLYKVSHLHGREDFCFCAVTCSCTSANASLCTSRGCLTLCVVVMACFHATDF